MANNNSSLPDYHERSFEYDEPEYLEGTSQLTNLKLYRDFKTLWAQRLFHDACDDYDWRRPEATSVHLTDYPYHPDFPEAFAAHVGGIHEDGGHLALEEVGYFLESTYGNDLERPDCDYLANILKDRQSTAGYPQNVEQALEWLVAKKHELPVWPPAYTESDTQGKKHRIYAPSTEIVAIKNKANSERLSVDNKKELQTKQKSTNPFYKLLLPRLPFPLLQKLLLSLDLIDSENNPTSKASPGALRGFIFALRERKCIKINSSATSKALKLVYSAQIHERYLQGEQGLSALKNDEQTSMFQETEDKLFTLLGAAGG